jgi:hypothetical protein
VPQLWTSGSVQAEDESVCMIGFDVWKEGRGGEGGRWEQR